MDKRFHSVIPAPLQATCDACGFSPAVRAGGVLHVSGQIGADPATLAVPEDFTQQVRLVFASLGMVLAEAGIGPGEVFSVTSYHVGDMASQMPVFIPAKAEFFGAPHPAWTAIGAASLALPGALIEVSALALARE